MNQRAISALPAWLLPCLLLALLLQTGWHYSAERSAAPAQIKPLNAPANPEFYRLLSLGSQKLMSYLLTLRLQLHDNQLGRNIRYRYLDYDVLSQWLMALYEMNPQSDYPAFLASRVYSQVKDKNKIRKMVMLVDALFDKNPLQHWRRMTEACVLAKHALNDLPLALKLAQKIANIPSSVNIPYWARDMKLVLLDDLNELESAQLLISTMLQEGDIQDPDEIRFLKARLLRIQQKMSTQQQQKPELSKNVK